jgi:hypothetical protein
MKTLLFTALLLSSLLPLHARPALDMGAPTARTPYDPHFGAVQRVLQGGGKAAPEFAKVELWLKQARAFRYDMDEPYRPQTPAATEQRRAGDCKDKSLWLLEKMGCGKARFVVGKAQRKARINHAWLMWQQDGRWWILDPTVASRPIAADSVKPDAYVPLYSYTRIGKRVHAAVSELKIAARVAAASSR